MSRRPPGCSALRRSLPLQLLLGWLVYSAGALVWFHLQNPVFGTLCTTPP